MLFEFSEESNKNTLGLLSGKTVSVNKLLGKNLNVNLNILSDYEFLLKEAINQKTINSIFLNDLKKWRKSPEKWMN